MSYVRPATRSSGPGTPRPIALDVVVEQLGDRGLELRERARPADSSDVVRSCRRRISPSRVTTPARIFVPPRSTPIACVPLTLSGYRNPPHGRPRGEAVPRLPRRTHERGRCRVPGGGDGKAPASSAGAGRVRKRWGWKRWTLLAILALIVLLVVWSVAGYLSVRSGVVDANKRLAPGTTSVAREAERPDPRFADEHPPARHRSLGERAGRPEHRPALRLDDAAAHRPEPPPARLPVDPARPRRRRSAATATRRSTPRCRSAGRSSRSRRSTTSSGRSSR